MNLTNDRHIIFLLASLGLLTLVIGTLATQSGRAAEPWDVAPGATYATIAATNAKTYRALSRRREAAIRVPPHPMLESDRSQPEITVAPLVLSATLGPGEENTRTLTISNSGSLGLSWVLAENPEAAWLAKEPVSGTISPEGVAAIGVTYDADGLSDGAYTTTLQVHSNDPDDPQIDVGVHLTVAPCSLVAGVDFAHVPPEPQAGDMVEFQGTVAQGSGLVSYAWSFGDGDSGIGQQVGHRFPLSVVTQTYTVVLTASGCVNEDTVSRDVTVGPSGGTTYVCDVPSVTHPLIQNAVDDPACEILNLAASTFNEDVTISRTLTLQGQGADLTFQEGSGGPVFLIEAGGVVTLTGMTIQNISNDYDGVLVNLGTLTVKDCVVHDNFSIFGGAIRNVGTLYVTHSTLSDNSAAVGGGIHNSGLLTVTNSTLANNIASGGGALLNDGGTVHVTNSTLSGNTANGGGILNAAEDVGRVYVTNSIVAQNSPSDCQGVITSQGYNMDSDGSCSLVPALGDLPNTDPRLGLLKDNGGPTLTRALLPGSPAIDAGGEDCPSTDQRGVLRPQDGDGDGIARCDIGAYEAQYVSVYLPLILHGTP